MSKPCEYCGADLPLGVDKGTRRVRSFHFASCEKRPKTTPPSMDIEAQRDALLEALQDLCDTLGECGMTERARAAIAAVEEGK
jgi:hypothetical protein